MKVLQHGTSYYKYPPWGYSRMVGIITNTHDEGDPTWHSFFQTSMMRVLPDGTHYYKHPLWGCFSIVLITINPHHEGAPAWH